VVESGRELVNNKFGGVGGGWMDSRDVIALLVEIRDLQRKHLEEYQRVTQESLDLARRSVLRQEQFARLYRAVLAVGALVLIGLGVFLAYVVGAFR
jgi:hypothetical protein